MAAKCAACGSFDVQAGLAELQCLGCGATTIAGKATGGVEVHSMTTTRDLDVSGDTAA